MKQRKLSMDAWNMLRKTFAAVLSHPHVVKAAQRQNEMLRGEFRIGGTVIFEAIEFAAKAHSNQYRKGTKIPYIVHPLCVGKILLQSGCSEAIVVVGILHDTVEDTSVTLEGIQRLFGQEVAQLVDGASEPNRSDTWENRKRHTIEYLKTAPPDVVWVSLADKLDNIRSIREDYETSGDHVWERFNRPMEKQAWYYRSLAEVFSKRHLRNPFEHLVKEFTSGVNSVFGKG
jgi:(p)ppGpp synthase/HD superfamily hydrolase